MRRAFYKWRALKGAAQRGETAASMARKFARQRTAGFPLPHGKFFCQLKRIFVNIQSLIEISPELSHSSSPPS